MRFVIKSSEVERVVSMWEGQERVSFSQVALLEQGAFVLSFFLTHFRSEDALPAGEYELDPRSFGSRGGRLVLERVRLRPVVSSRASAPVK